jgi:hypothetical protein
MSWSPILGKQKTTHENAKTAYCASCNQPIASVSITLYEIDAKHYCSACYYKIIINEAVERDHFDLKRRKEALKQFKP